MVGIKRNVGLKQKHSRRPKKGKLLKYTEVENYAKMSLLYVLFNSAWPKMTKNEIRIRKLFLLIFDVAAQTCDCLEIINIYFV